MSTSAAVTAGRALGIDYGSERIGLALSDPLGIIATPFRTVRNGPTACAEIQAVVEAERVSAIVVGWPLNLKGQEGMKAAEVDRFIQELESHLGRSVIRLDERFTTTIARRTMIGLGTKKKTRETDRGRVDEMAAAVLLQGYLDTYRRAHG